MSKKPPSIRQNRTTKEIEDMIHSQMITEEDYKEMDKSANINTEGDDKMASGVINRNNTNQQDSKEDGDDFRDSAVDLPDDICNTLSEDEELSGHLCDSSHESSDSDSGERSHEESLPNTLRRTGKGSRVARKRQHRAKEIGYHQFSTYGWPMEKAYYCEKNTDNNDESGTCTPEAASPERERHSASREPVVEEVIQKSTKVLGTEKSTDDIFKSIF